MTDSISTTSVWPNYSTSNVQAAAAKTNNDSLGRDAFLNILVTQLRNQDPLEPLSDTDFIAQMAQFTSVEQLMDMSTELALLRQNIGSASSLIGKTIEWSETEEDGSTVTASGVVDSIISKDGILYAAIGATQVVLDDVTSISETSSETDDAESSETDDADSAQSEEGAATI